MTTDPTFSARLAKYMESCAPGTNYERAISDFLAAEKSALPPAANTGLRPCLFCKASGDEIDICSPSNGNVVFVECHQCGACGPSYENAIYSEAVRQAKNLWNGYSIDGLSVRLPPAAASGKDAVALARKIEGNLGPTIWDDCEFVGIAAPIIAKALHLREAALWKVVEAAKKLKQAVAINDIRSTTWSPYLELNAALDSLDAKAVK